MSTHAISVRDLVRTFRIRQERGLLKGLFHPRYEEVRAVDGISFTVAPGEAVAFLGPNGAGKTTTLKMLTGLIVPTSGEARVLDCEPFARKRDFLRRIGLVMGNKAGLNWDLTARQSFELFRWIYRIPEADYAARLSEMSEVLDVARLLDRQVRRLSLGERMKLELIGAVLHSPEVLFLDEPTIGLDVVSKRSLRTFLRDWQRRTGFTMVLTSHDMADVEEICDRVIVINHGHLVHDGPLGELARHYARVRYVRLTFEAAPPSLELPEGAVEVERDETSVLLRLPASALVDFVGHATASHHLADLHVEAVPLEEIITDLFARRA